MAPPTRDPGAAQAIEGPINTDSNAISRVEMDWHWCKDNMQSRYDLVI